MSIEQPKSKLPLRNYCDITGFEVNYQFNQTKYKDKLTKMYFCDKYAF